MNDMTIKSGDKEIDFERDAAGDVLVSVTDYDNGMSFWISKDDAEKLKEWLAQ